MTTVPELPMSAAYLAARCEEINKILIKFLELFFSGFADEKIRSQRLGKPAAGPPGAAVWPQPAKLLSEPGKLPATEFQPKFSPQSKPDPTSPSAAT